MTIFFWGCVYGVVFFCLDCVQVALALRGGAREPVGGDGYDGRRPHGLV